MLEIIKAFLPLRVRLPMSQRGSQKGQYYERTGSCNQCGKCCTNIYLVYNERTIDSLPMFEDIKKTDSEYESFEPIGSESDGSILFQCRHLQVDNSCGIYDNRPDFCRRYPSEQGLLMGGKLSDTCGYQFRLLKSFQDVLSELPGGKL